MKAKRQNIMIVNYTCQLDGVFKSQIIWSDYEGYDYENVLPEVFVLLSKAHGYTYNSKSHPIS